MTTWTVPGVTERIVDADTLDALLSLGWHVHWRGRLRLLGVDAPELNTDAGKAAKAFVEALLPPGAPFTFASAKLDSFGRSLGTLTLADGSDLGQRLLDAGHAVAYVR